jgi:aminoglycoside phosphotransferase (APT) family kinase protein
MTTDPETTARQLCGQVPGWSTDELTLRPGVVPMASPMNQGVDALAFRVRNGASGHGAWLRIAHEDSRLFADPATVVEAARRAGALGVAPKVLAADETAGAILMEDLSDSHRVGTLDKLIEPAIREAVVRAKTAIHAAPPLGRPRSVFDQVKELVATAEREGAILPEDIAFLRSNVAWAGEAIGAAGVDTVAAHGDGNVSNIMIGADGAVMLVDFDMAADMDPFEDLGSLIAEAHPFDPEARETFEMFHGSFDERLFNRARLYGVADDLRWGLIGAILARTSARDDLEFLKYSDWRMLRARMSVRDPRFEERVRRV